MPYLVRKHTSCAHKYSKGNILEMLTHNIFVEFGGRIPCAFKWAQIVELILYSFETEFTLRNKKKEISPTV